MKDIDAWMLKKAKEKAESRITILAQKKAIVRYLRLQQQINEQEAILAREAE